MTLVVFPLIAYYKMFCELSVSVVKGSNGQLCVTLIWKLVRSSVTQCFQNFKNKSWIRWWNSSETGLHLCKVPKTNQNFFVCVQMPLCVQLWPLISCSSQVQMPHFCFHGTYTNIFYLHCKFLNSMKKNKRVNFSKKKLKNLMTALEKLYGTLKCSREIVVCQPNSKFLKAKDSTWNCLQHDQAGNFK